jgi:hypothetical protein
MYLVGFENRVVVFLRWGFSYFTFNRGARLITGEREPTEAERRFQRLMANKLLYIIGAYAKRPNHLVPGMRVIVPRCGTQADIQSQEH